MHPAEPRRVTAHLLHLEAERMRIHDEIMRYPSPIPACDEHFNFLLEERTRIGRELRRAKRAEGETEATS